MVFVRVEQEVKVECEDEKEYDAHYLAGFRRRVPAFRRSCVLAVNAKEHADHPVEAHRCTRPRGQLWQEVGQEREYFTYDHMLQLNIDLILRA